MIPPIIKNTIGIIIAIQLISFFIVFYCFIKHSPLFTSYPMVHSGHPILFLHDWIEMQLSEQLMQ